ncbi:hypothetical protein C9374_000679 [Naegleria lovaniensis]|uniref:AB hydrolase-1 domain-containing protein n=1 Tax=Naegleria lovaniensis TaxID=51637 RepID=A0AA88GWX6_NAELO|nr:uncharacterized protein C9374_000679 [Naegleria lovaniensis]KAG2388515.1 hypothetical protein C9374_000679 [Naegleria lovaniensis]
MDSKPSSNTSVYIGMAHWPLLVWSVLNALTGLLGMIIYGSETTTFGPVYIMNQYVGLWLCVLLFFFSVQGIYHELKPADDRMKILTFFMNLLYFTLVFIGSIILFLGYAINGVRSDCIIWTILIMLMCGLNIVIVVLRYFAGVGTLKPQRQILPSESACYGKIREKSSPAASKVVACLHVTCIVMHVMLRVLLLLFMILLMVGAINAAYIVNYPMKGKLVKVELNDGSGRFQNIHYLCAGPKENNSFTFLLEGDFSHGYADYWDIQQHLTSLGRRSCIYDKPGLGYSDYLYKGQTDEATFYYNFLTSIGENMPFVLVGWGGGGHLIYKFAHKHPELVKSLTFLDVFPPGIEFTSIRDLKNLTQSQYEQYKSIDKQGRKTLLGIINGLGVPWGLMSIFVMENSKNSNSKEIAFWMRTEKTWITQASQMDLYFSQDSSSFLKQSLASNITINLVISKHNDTWVKTNNYVCKTKGTESQDCAFEIEKNNYYMKSQLEIVPTLNGGTITYCTDDSCGLSYYTFINPSYTASTLNQLYPK